MADHRRNRARIKYPPSDHPKVCKSCGVEKPAERYFKVKMRKDGRDAICKDCRNPSIVAKNSSPERRAVLLQRSYAHRGTEHGKEQRRRHHREAARRRAEQAGREYRPHDPFATAEKKAVIAWRRWIRATAPSWWLDTYYSGQEWRDHRRPARERERLRYRLDPEYHLCVRLREAAKSKARKRGIDSWKLRERLRLGKPWQTLFERCGYSVNDLKTHLEKQFTRGMSWDRFCAGEIDIDHIVPLRCFDLAKDNEVRHAWALANLRPLWPVMNASKGGAQTHLL